MIQEKAKSFYNNLKQKEGERSKTSGFNASEGCFDDFAKRFGLRNVKTTEEASTEQGAADEFQTLLKTRCY